MSFASRRRLGLIFLFTVNQREMTWFNTLVCKLQSQQLALSLRDEVLDLEAVGIAAIQVDEPAICEGVS